MFSARFTPASGSAVDLSLDITTRVPVDVKYDVQDGVAECRVHCHFFANETSPGLDTANTQAQTRVALHTHLEAIRTNCKFKPPIRKPMARGHVKLFSPHNNSGPLVLFDGTNSQTIFSSCWLDRIEVQDDGLLSGVKYDLVFVSEKDPTSYL